MVKTADLVAVAKRSFRTGPPVTLLLQRYRSYICPFDRLIELVPPGSSVLDVGCGSGLFLSLLWQVGTIRSGLGFDADPRAIGVAQAMARLTARPGASLDFRHLPVEAPWPNGPFDVVSIVDVVHHLPDQVRREVIRLAAERVGPGGILLYKDIGTAPLWRAWASRLHDLLLARQWVWFTPMAQIDDWAREAGLERVHRSSANLWWYGHELAVYRKPAAPQAGPLD